MLINKTLSAILIGLLLFGNIFAQQAVVSNPKPPEISPELRKNAVDFLRQTIKEIPNLKAEENRQYFTIETARLLWKYDEKESRKMFEQASNDLKQSISKIVEKYQKESEEIKKKIKENPNLYYGVNRPAVNAAANVYYSNHAINRDSPKANISNAVVNSEPKISIYQTGLSEQFRMLSMLRQNLLESIADADPVAAYQLLTETKKMIPQEINGYEDRNYSHSIETAIVDGLLKRGEIDKSLEIAHSVFDKDLSSGFFTILSLIYAKDQVKGSRLAEEFFIKIKTSGKNKISLSQLSILFDMVVKNKQQQSPMLVEKSLRELAELIGDRVLEEISRDYYYLDPFEYAKKIKEYAPREALKIMQKANQLKIRDSHKTDYSNSANAVEVANKAVTIGNASPKSKNKKPKATPTPVVSEPDEFEQEKQETLDKDVLLQKLMIGKLTPEERKKAIESAKRIAFASNRWGYTRPDGFFAVVGDLARFSLFSADKEVSEELMKEAEIYVRPQTKTFVDYGMRLLLAGGYSKHRPEKSFAIMESMTPINEIIESAVKVGTFIDFAEMFVPNDEVNAAAFLGEFGVTRNISQQNELGIFIQNLAKADFKRTASLAEKFERKEFKMAAKMLILENLLGTPRKIENRGGEIDF